VVFVAQHSPNTDDARLVVPCVSVGVARDRVSGHTDECVCVCVLVGDCVCVHAMKTVFVHCGLCHCVRNAPHAHRASAADCERVVGKVVGGTTNARDRVTGVDDGYTLAAHRRLAAGVPRVG
jgi:hypothetical protein